MNKDGINAYCPSNQPQEFYKRLSPRIKKCLEAYNARTYVELLNQADDENPPWYPMWTYTNALTNDTADGKVMNQINSLKLKYLPEIVMSRNFDSEWKKYCDEYAKLDTDVYFDALTAEVRRRCRIAQN